MRKILAIITGIIIGIILIFIGAMSLSSGEQIDEKINIATLIATPDVQIAIQDTVEINDLPFVDNPEVYQFDDPDSVVYMYITVQTGNSSDKTDHTWEEINSNSKWFFTNQVNVVVDKAEVIVQIGDETGPLPGEIGYAELAPNATIQIRGASSSLLRQKSYKIEMRDRAGKWRGQSTIALNKHVSDLSRARNKLAFDLMKEIPDLVSLRTQFVRLYVKDETSDPPSEVFVDYGLFTQVEQPNKAFLRNHLLDEDAQLYKANHFEFYRYPDLIKTVDDSNYYQSVFEEILEIKGNQDHTKLIQMLDDVNNYAIPIEQTFEKYFDADNYFTWLAFNILVGNIDTQSQNFYLYSPQNSEKWYFIPWDYDASFSRLNREIREQTPYENWEYGIANYWGSVLPNRVLRIEAYQDLLTEKVEELKIFLTDERIQSMLETYRTVIEPYISRMPDVYYRRGTINDFDQEYSTILLEVENNYQLYYESFQDPMPFHLGKPRYEGQGMYFNWEDSYDFGAQDITYQFVLSRDWEFQDIVLEREVKNITYVNIPDLDPGTYFWKVTAENEDGREQSSFSFYTDAEGNIRSGLKYLFITADGEIVEE